MEQATLTIPAAADSVRSVLLDPLALAAVRLDRLANRVRQLTNT